MPDTPAHAAAAAVRRDRLWDRLLAMAEIGRIEDTGVNRACLSADDIRARALLIDWARARGFALAVDPAANLFVRRAGSEPDLAPILVGSHMDSQPRGGRFDGILGVLAGLEVLEALEDAAIRTRHPLEAVAWTNEEGGRFAPGCMGSAAFAGAAALDTFLNVTDSEGVPFRDALAATLAATPEVERRALGTPVHAFLELHIEQGPQLEAGGRTIGVVSGIQGSRWFEVTVEGELAHAGTAPLAGRKDALRAAVRAIGAVQELTHDPTDVVRFTVGRFEAEPGAYNTVANRARFTIDLRHPEVEVLARLGDAVAPTATRAAAPCQVRVAETFGVAPVVFPQHLVTLLEGATRALGLPYAIMPSGAFHDAGFLARVGPSAMVFVPCRAGISHNPAESAEPAHCAAGTQVLAAAIVDLDAQSGAAF
jgi:N-carbamoyl-L-amino-acid hydrolase